MLRLNGKPIWNIVDLKNEFSPTEIYRQKKDFLLFAKVHCMVLSTRLTDNRGDGYEACFLTKDFWYKILSFDESITSEIPWLDFFVEKRIVEELGESYSKSEEKSVREDIENEIKDAFIREKIDCIIKDSNEDMLKALVLLAICEIAEIDAREQSFAAAVADNTSVQLENEVREIVFDDDKTLTLEASKTHYLLRVFEGNVLPTDAKIRTIKLEAVASVNKYDNAVLDFCNKNGEIISSVSVRPGEYRYINVVLNEVIGFLPSVSMENGCCVYRNGYNSRNIKIATKGSQPRTISKYEYEGLVSAGKNAGAIFIRNGKIVTDYCDISLDYRTKIIFDMIAASLDIVEIAYVSDTVKVLADNGRVYSILLCNGDVCSWGNVSVKSPEAENVVSLRKEIRIGREKKNAENILESTVSCDETETAALLRSGECEINYK